MLSFWERESFLRYDHIVVGSGITGLSVALELRKTFPKARILVLERGLFPTGASTRNAGFACMGSASELLDDLKTQNEADVVSLFARRKKGLDLLRARLGDERLDYRKEGGYELIAHKDRAILDKLDYLNSLLQPILNDAAYIPQDDAVKKFGFAEQSVATVIYSPFEGSIHTGKAIRALLDLAIAQGIEVKTGASVTRFFEEKDRMEVQVTSSNKKEAYSLKCKTLCICTNAFTPHLLPEVDVVPGRGQIILTKPIPGLRLKGIFHYDEGYYYFREIEGRVLLGGGRNLDFSAEQTEEFALSSRIQNSLEEMLTNMILPGQQFELDMRWAGIMAFGKSKSPVIKTFSNRLFGAFRFGGMGVALSSLAAQEIAQLIQQKKPNN
ncbi:MAG: FAD-binding oxidoreductase [Bacteroidetes bacterium]|nr:FAD-binding oxidoreductase [Bacteroidota bacterium]